MKRKVVTSVLLGILALGVGYEVMTQQLPAVEKEELLFVEIPTVITPAKKEQRAVEAPAIVTVITAEEIKQMGARNLLDVLKIVPGFNIIQDTNEHLVAVRGIYASTNQKFLLR